MKPTLFAFAVLAVACNKPDAAKTQGGGEAGKDGKDGKDGSQAASGPTSAEQGATAGAKKVSECPKSLGGSESGIDRVIARDCGAVPVTEDYRIDGGSLTLEAGASLAFTDGAGLVVGYGEPAKLIVKGTPEQPVTLTASGDKVAGVWRGIVLHDKAARSSVVGAVIEYVGEEDGALKIHAPDVTLTGTTLRETKGAGLRLEGEGRLAAFTGNTFSKLGSKAAIVAPPPAIAGIAAGNKFDGGAYVQVENGSLAKTTTWPNPGIPLLLAEQVAVDSSGGERAILTLSPGTELRFMPDGRLGLGYHGTAGLVARGTAEAPITFTAAEKREPGAWTGVTVWSQGEADIEHAVFEFGGKEDDRGALVVEDGQLTLKDVTFRSNRIGVTVRGAASKLRAFADNKFAATPVAVTLPAELVGSLGEGNAFDADAKIEVEGGQVTGKQTWLAQGAPLVLGGEVSVGGELTLDAGLKVLARPGVTFSVGYGERAKLTAKGTAGSPITFAPTEATWNGIKVHPNTTSVTLEHVQLREVGEEAGVWVDGPVEVRLDNVSCAKCKAAVVGWSCEAKVSSSSVLATEGTPAIEKKPEGC